MIHPSELMRVSWQCVHFAQRNEIEQVRNTLTKSDFTAIECNVGSAGNDIELFGIISKALEFPDYFGNNWDAFDECLIDMEWLPSEGYVLVLFNANELWRNATYSAGKLVSAWQTAAAQWGREGVPFHLIFVL